MNGQMTRLQIDQILSYLTASLPFVNCHMVDFITNNLWEKFVPNAIQKEIQNTDDAQLASKLFFDQKCTDRFPELQKFIAESTQHHLENLNGVYLSSSHFLDCSGLQTTPGEFEYLNIKDFMNEKKNHEVDITSRLVSVLTHKIATSTERDVYVLDAGDGKGYLSSRLVLQYNMKVLGIDASEINTVGSQKRMKKLERAWAGLEERTKMANIGLTPKRRSKRKVSCNNTEPKAKSPYKSINKYITMETDFSSLVKENFTVKEKFVMCLTGLHTCGNLGPTCVEAFVRDEGIKLLCNIGCCYHLLSEMFLEDNITNADHLSKSYGFPMSNYLRTKEVQLGRNARMLASQSIHRTQTMKDLDIQPLFYRALLEVLIREACPHEAVSPRVGKVKKFTNFEEYLMRCEDKCRLGLKTEKEYMDQIVKRHSSLEHFMCLFYLIRMSYAQVIESLILLDRLLFLRERGIENSYLVRLFDPVISPRCYGIIAMR